MICGICRTATEPDDVVAGMGKAGCVCLRCYQRVTNSARPTPAWLRRELIAALGGIDVTER